MDRASQVRRNTLLLALAQCSLLVSVQGILTVGNLAIVDLTMPEIKGTELVKMLEAGGETPKPKFIVIMTAALGETISELRRLGYPVIAKPMDLESLEKNVLAACEKYHLALKQQSDSKH